MGTLIAIAITVIIGGWFGRRFAPALIGVLVVLAAPLWLILGFIWDTFRKIHARLKKAILKIAKTIGIKA